MNKKKVFLLLISLVFMMSLLSNFVSAQEEEGALAGAFDVIRRVFGFIPEMVTLEKLADGDAGAVFWAKFLIWVALVCHSRNVTGWHSLSSVLKHSSSEQPNWTLATQSLLQYRSLRQVCRKERL